jgi:acyl-CoA synthetase (AMP-forming)/AMP-acid ligase II
LNLFKNHVSNTTPLTLGGENIFPLEIEERIVQHPSIVQASVIGISDAKYGEAVGVFLHHRSSQPRPSTQALREFVRKTLAWHKAPEHVFWLEIGEDFPKTGSGKIKKHVLKDKAETLMKKNRRVAKL